MFKAFPHLHGGHLSHSCHTQILSGVGILCEACVYTLYLSDLSSIAQVKLLLLCWPIQYPTRSYKIHLWDAVTHICLILGWCHMSVCHMHMVTNVQDNWWTPNIRKGHATWIVLMCPLVVPNRQTITSVVTFFSSLAWSVRVTLIWAQIEYSTGKQGKVQWKNVYQCKLTVKRKHCCCGKKPKSLNLDQWLTSQGMWVCCWDSALKNGSVSSV